MLNSFQSGGILEDADGRDPEGVRDEDNGNGDKNDNGDENVNAIIGGTNAGKVREEDDMLDEDDEPSLNHL